MKRAAGQIRKGRRNKGGDKDDDLNFHDQVQQPVRRKPTPEESALTAKNYRLAKELSDLRVRHREECKTVSRLTMENMNLASRWREAIGHVAVLKKELAMQQRKSVEAQAQLQRIRDQVQASERTNGIKHNYTPTKTGSPIVYDDSPTSSPDNAAGTSLQDVAAEMDRMDRILAAHQAQSGTETSPTHARDDAYSSSNDQPSTPQSKDSFTEQGKEKKTQSLEQAVTPSPEKKQLSDDDKEECQTGHQKDRTQDFFTLFDNDTEMELDNLEVEDPPLDVSPPSASPSESPPPSPPQEYDTNSPPTSFDEKHNGFGRELQAGDPPLFPMTASPKLTVKARAFNEEYPADISSEVVKHPRSAERHVAAGFNDIPEEENSAHGPGTRPPPVPLSGIDAFEASFATQFPDSFSPTEENTHNKANMTNAEENSEEYNPFFPSPSEEEESEETTADRSPTTSPTATPRVETARNSPSNQEQLRGGQADNPPSPVIVGKPRQETSISNGYHRESPTARKNGIAPNTNDSPSSAGSSSRRNSSHAAHTPEYHPDGSPGQESNGVRYETPPQSQRSPEIRVSDGPKRPEKAGAAAARARYEKALQPRFSGTSKRFPRRADQEVGGGASPLNAATASGASNKGDTWRTEVADIEASRNKLAMAQARVKERTTAYTARFGTSGRLDQTASRNSATAFPDNSWAPRPSPTDSVASKPWDEEVGDIPLTSSPSQPPRRSGQTVDGGTNPMGTSNESTAYFSRSSPIGGSPRSKVMGRDRPWDRSNAQQEQPPRASQSAALRASNFLAQQQQQQQQGELPGTSGDSPSSRFIAAGKNRRRVKQPVSYAEPPLNSKLRRGDVYFPKEDEGDEIPEVRSYSSTLVNL